MGLGFGNWVDRLFNQHKLVRRGTVVWIVALTTAATIQVFWFTKGELTQEYLGLIALIGTILTFFRWSKTRDDERNGK